jgi:hypothetical protein
MAARKAVATASAVQTAVTHTIDLDPTDWYIATWRRLPPLPRPEPAPFDRDDCLDRVRRVVSRTPYVWEWDWGRAEISVSLTAEEARFWAETMTQVTAATKRDDLLQRLQEQDLTAPLTADDLVARLSDAARYSSFELVKPLCCLFSPRGFVELLLRPDLIAGQAHLVQANMLRAGLVAGFRRFVVPYLHPHEMEALRQVVAAHPPGRSVQPPAAASEPALLLAAALGMHAEVLNYVASCPNGILGTYAADDASYWMVFGLGSAKLVDHHARRTGLQPWRTDYCRGWLAHTEFSGLDLLYDTIVSLKRQREQESLLDVLKLVKAPEAAPHVLRVKLESKAVAPAREWLEEQVGNAIAGLMPLTVGRGKLAEAALDYLRQTRAHGFDGVIAEQIATASPEVADKVRREVLEQAALPYPLLDEEATPLWLREEPAGKRKPAKLPDWAHPAALPVLTVGDRCLQPCHIEVILRALQKSTLEAPAPLIAPLLEHGDRQRLETFAWKLFELWLAEGGDAKEKWAFHAVGLLGEDTAAMRLAPLIRAWPGQSQHRRAVLGLECLRAIGTDTALMQLAAIAQKVKFKRLQEQAQGFMMEIAMERGLSPAQLEDRVVPDLDLDEKGGRVFDFGPRQFRFVLDADLKPLVRDAAGKLRGELPKPNTKDDPEKASQAVAAWKLLKKQVRDVVRFQARRLEEAMVSLRRWSVREFETYLVHHRLMINLVRRVLWGGYDDRRRLLRTFRVTEDSTYADIDDRTCTLEGLGRIGVVHPLHLPEDQRAAWGEVLGDYEIIAPFPQLARRVHTLQPGEETARELTRFGEARVPSLVFMGILKSHGWTDGRYGGDHYYHGWHKMYPGAEVTACLKTDASGDTLRARQAYFVVLGQPPDLLRALPLGQVDPVVLSEVLGSLGVLAAKGE